MLGRLSGGAGKELLPTSSSSKDAGKMYSDTAASSNANAGRQLLPSKAARPTRSSQQRGPGPVNPSAHSLLMQSLDALSGEHRNSGQGRSSASGSPAVGGGGGRGGGGGVNIMGAAGLIVVRSKPSVN